MTIPEMFGHCKITPRRHLLPTYSPNVYLPRLSARDRYLWERHCDRYCARIGLTMGR